MNAASGGRESGVTPILLHNAGTIVTGRLESPRAGGDALLVDNGVVHVIGARDDVDPGGEITRIDVGGGLISPGLIDPHTHPVLGDWTPRQNASGWIGNYLNGGVTTLISAGETHWPGRLRTGAGAKTMAIAACQSSSNLRPGGARLIAGALLLEEGLAERDFDEMHEAGVRLLGEVGLGSVVEADEVRPLVGWAKQRGWTVPMHVGGNSVPGSHAVGAELVLAVQPDVASHLNGGPTARPLAEIEQIIDGTGAAIEVVQAGNIRALVDIVAMLRQREQVGRLQIGTDTPSGTGVVPLGMLRTVAYCAALGGLDPAEALCCASGQTARRYRLGTGDLEAGSPADVVVLHAPAGGSTLAPLDALAAGDTPSVTLVMVDGEVQLRRSAMTPPPLRAIVESAPSRAVAASR